MGGSVSSIADCCESICGICDSWEDIKGCCCPSEKNSDWWNEYTLGFASFFYNKQINRDEPDVESTQFFMESTQFFKKHKFSFNDIKNREYFLCCCCCKYIQWSTWKRNRCGHSAYTCFSEPFFNFGFFSFCCPWFQAQPIRTIMIAGLSGSGKTFLMRKLLTQTGNPDLRPEAGPPTKGFVDTVITFNLWQKYEVFDFGGSDVQRQFWRTYYGLMVKFDTVVYCINASAYLRTNFSDKIVNQERDELHKLMACPEVRKCQLICYLIFDDTVTLNWKDKEHYSEEILGALEVRSRGSKKGRTKFNSQSVDFVATYIDLLYKLEIDFEIHGNGILSTE
ncbi:hypothetical protein AAMO2058_001303500 [Amorphochlora amoebiformis]